MFAVIGVGVRLIKKFKSYFSDRLTFSNIRGRTSRRIYRVAVALFSLEISLEGF